MTGWVRRLRAMNPGEPLRKILLWEVARLLLWAILTALYGYRYYGSRCIPRHGPVLLVCNHQSFMDLAVLGVGIRGRQYHAMARKTLFRNPWFAAVIRAFNAFEVDQEGGDLRAMRTAIQLLKRNHLVLVFPEGRRTRDGTLGPFHEGLHILIKRARPSVVPMAVDGPYDVWPRGQVVPRLRGRVGAIYGEPISSEELLSLSPDAIRQRLRAEVESLRLTLRGRLRRQSGGRYPRPGPADSPAVVGKEKGRAA